MANTPSSVGRSERGTRFSFRAMGLSIPDPAGAALGAQTSLHAGRILMKLQSAKASKLTSVARSGPEAQGSLRRQCGRNHRCPELGHVQIPTLPWPAAPPSKRLLRAVNVPAEFKEVMAYLRRSL